MEFKEMTGKTEEGKAKEEERVKIEKLKAHLDNQAFSMGYEKRPAKPAKLRKRRKKKG